MVNTLGECHAVGGILVHVQPFPRRHPVSWQEPRKLALQMSITADLIGPLCGLKQVSAFDIVMF